MLYHHSDVPYAVALEQCAENTKRGYQKLLDQGRSQLPKLLDTLQDVPDDALVVGDKMQLEVYEKQRRIVTTGSQGWELHDNAWKHICGKLKFSLEWSKYLETTEWGRELEMHNINTLFKYVAGPRRFLVRSVRNQMRALLSDRYRRLDARPLLDSFFELAKLIGAVPIKCYATDVKCEVRFALPTIFEPVAGEPIMFWISISTSDYGLGKLNISMGLTRPLCTNFATTEEIYGQVHLGKQLPETIEFSQETYAKDTELVVSATRDIFLGSFSDKNIDHLCHQMMNASEVKGPRKLEAAFKAVGLSKGEAEKAETLYKIPDIEVLPKGDTMWRFSNAISFIAQAAENPLRQMELEKIAGRVLTDAKPVLEAELVEVA